MSQQSRSTSSIVLEELDYLTKEQHQPDDMEQRKQISETKVLKQTLDWEGGEIEHWTTIKVFQDFDEEEETRNDEEEKNIGEVDLEVLLEMEKYGIENSLEDMRQESQSSIEPTMLSMSLPLILSALASSSADHDLISTPPTPTSPTLSSDRSNPTSRRLPLAPIHLESEVSCSTSFFSEVSSYIDEDGPDISGSNFHYSSVQPDWPSTRKLSLFCLPEVTFKYTYHTHGELLLVKDNKYRQFRCRSSSVLRGCWSVIEVEQKSPSLPDHNICDSNF